MSRPMGLMPKAVAVAFGATAALLSCGLGVEGFSYSQAAPLQLRQQHQAQQGLQPQSPIGLTDGAEGLLVGRVSPESAGYTAFRGAALGVVSLVTLYVLRKYRRVWRRKVNSQCRGWRGIKADKRPSLLGPEKPPHEKKKIYHYYCNKLYKVIREEDLPSRTTLRAAAVDVAPTTSEATSEFVSPAIWNKPVLRAAAVISGGALAGGVLPFAAMLHLSAFGIWLGTNVWTTFVAGLTMFKNLPRQQFGSLQSKLFPQYFQLGAACTSILLLTGSRLGLPLGPGLLSLFATLANMLYLEPEATSVMFERYERENQGIKEPAVDKELKAKFSKLHGMSSLANLVALVGLVAHGALLASRLSLG